jgi:pyroglutamyl-peptidase
MRLSCSVRGAGFRPMLFLFCWGLASVLSHRAVADPPDSDRRPQKRVEAQKQPIGSPTASPVILLTGFEPFGPGRPPNCSWDGISDFNGRSWNGYRIVAKQLPVVWGKPLDDLQKWINEYQPVAIFSFGQGGEPTFRFETRASNRRGRHPDNDDQLPSSRLIVKDGPDELRATADCEHLARLMADKGHPVRVSSNAGHYLCEENLYTLEYLKETKKLKATVLFCHVPCEREPEANAARVHHFVGDLLESWRTLSKAGEAGATGDKRNETADAKSTAIAARDGQEPVDEARHRDVKQFVEGYFRSWSNQDVKGYGECFATEAAIQTIGPHGQVTVQGRKKFLAEQAEFLATQRATEVPESIRIVFESELARVVVYWKLTSGGSTKYGYDHFTLMKRDGKWQILNLVFYEVAHRK